MFLILVAGLSALHLFNHKTDPIQLSCLVSLIGLTATVLYFMKIEQYKILVYIWTFAQVLVIDKTYYDPLTQLHYYTAILDLSQVYNLNFGLDLGLESGKLGIHINLLSILLIGFLKVLPKIVDPSSNQEVLFTSEP